MPFSFFSTKVDYDNLTDEKKILTALQKYLEAIAYLEQSIVDDICSFAKKTENYKPALNQFFELSDLYSTYPFLCREEAILDSYRKRDILLDQLTILIGKNPDIYKGPQHTNNNSTTNNDSQAITIGAYRKNLGLSTEYSINQESFRTAAKTTQLKSEVSNVLHQQSLSASTKSRIAKNTFYTRMKNAEYHYKDNEDQLNKIPDTSKIDGFWTGVIKFIKSFFSSVSDVAEMIQDVKPMLASAQPPKTGYVSLPTPAPQTRRRS